MKKIALFSFLLFASSCNMGFEVQNKISSSVSLNSLASIVNPGVYDISGVCAPEDLSVTLDCGFGSLGPVNCTEGVFTVPSVTVSSVTATCQATLVSNDGVEIASSSEQTGSYLPQAEISSPNCSLSTNVIADDNNFDVTCSIGNTVSISDPLLTSNPTDILCGSDPQSFSLSFISSGSANFLVTQSDGTGNISRSSQCPLNIVVATSCNDLLTNKPGLADGVYTIDPDGPAGNSPFSAYCDMTRNGGGWTLLAKSNENNDILTYSAAVWDTGVPFNENDFVLWNSQSALYPAYENVVGGEFWVEMETLGSINLDMPVNNTGLFYATNETIVFSENTSGTAHECDWSQVSPNFEPNWNLQVASVKFATGLDSFGNGDVRFGLVADNLFLGPQPDSGVGIGVRFEINQTMSSGNGHWLESECPAMSTYGTANANIFDKANLWIK